MTPSRTPLVVAGTVATAVLVLHAEPKRVTAAPSIAVAKAAPAPAEIDCPPDTIPDGDVCVHVEEEAAADAPVARGAHRERSGRWSVYDQIPRRPERPADYDAYRYPIPPGLANGRSVLSGYDLDLPDPDQRRGRRIRAVGHGGVDLPQRKGTPIRAIPLDHQEGDATVLYVGDLFGRSVVTRHVLREAGGLRTYVLIFGHLDAPAPGLARGAPVREGDVVGFVGDTGSPELVHLHLEARRLRDGVDLDAHAGPDVVSDAVTIVCDPRNVLLLR